MKFYIGQFSNVANIDDSPTPNGCIGSLDIGGTARNVGLFVLPNNASLSTARYSLIGQADSSDSVLLSNTDRQLWQSRLNLPIRPTANTLTDLLFETLTSFADGTGVNYVRPLVPGYDGKLKLFLANSQVLEREWQDNQDPKHALAILEQLRNTYSEYRQQAVQRGSEYRRKHHLRWLAVQSRKYKLDRAGWRAIQGDNPEEELENPATTYTESFPTDGALTSGQDQTWALIAAGTYDVSSNAIRSLVSSQHRQCYVTSPLSSDDQYCQITKTSGDATYSLGPTCRMDGSSYSGYYSMRYSSTIYLRWWLNNNVGTTLGGFQSLPETFRVEADGSSISHYKNAVLQGSYTDTNVASGSYCGVYSYSSPSQADDWEAGDLGGATAKPLRNKLATLGVGA